MKGVLFTQFLRFADDEFGTAITGSVAERTRYSATGEYDHRELHDLVRELGRATGRTSAELLGAFGRELFHYFANMYPVFFAGADSAVGFLSGVDTYIHGELVKLYPGAQFPRFDVSHPAADRLEMVYRSERQLADLAEGLIRGCVEHFGDSIEVRREDLPSAEQQVVRFILRAVHSPTLP